MDSATQNKSAVSTLQVAGHSYKICLPHAATDYIQGKISKEGAPYELEMLNDMRTRVLPGDFVIDVGANVGNHTLFLAACGCDVLAFEPNTQLIAALQASIELNDWSNRVSLHTVGLGKELSAARFAKDNPSNMGAMSLQTGTGELKIVTLDSCNLQRAPALIKIDVEGMELDVLLGAERLITESRPLIYVESLTQLEFRSVFNWLSERGYIYWDTFNASPTHLFFPVEKTTPDQRISRLQYKEVCEAYRTTGQLNRLRRQIDDEKQKNKIASEALISATIQANRLKEEELRYKQSTTQLAAQLQTLRLDSEHVRTTASEQEANLKKTLADRESVLHAEQAKLQTLSLEFEHARKIASEQEANFKKTLIEREAALHAEQAKLQTLRLESEHARKTAIEQEASLKKTLADREAALHAEQAQLKSLRLDSEHARKTASEQKARLKLTLTDRDASLRAEQSQLKSLRLESEHARKTASEQESSLKQALADREAALRAEQAKLKSLGLESEHASKTAIEQEVSLKKTLADREAALRAEQAKLKSLHLDLEHARKTASDQLALKTQALNEEKKHSDKLDVNFKGMLVREQRYKERIAELEKTARQVSHLDLRIRRSEREKISAEKRADDLKKTISFQLGFAIIQATKSWRGMVQLPAAIFQARAEAKLRRDVKLLKLGQIPLVSKPESAKKVQTVVDMAAVFKANVPTPQSRLRVAAVMDEFTFHSYNPECELLQLHPDTCVQQLTDFKPDLLFIESAWKGLEGLWQTKISNNGPEINDCITWCKVNKVPTMFWNKEDPVHFSTFIPLAQKIDYVFTTDIDCIPKYKHAIGHERVFLLPFAAQPKTHNPIELFDRKDAFNFAGSYYLRYPERQRDFAALIDTVKTFKTVDIYDRNFDNPHPHYTFPDAYKPMILGRLPFEEIDKAYKGYRYGINMNTIKQSQTMFARRVFELLASNTVVVSNFSRGVRLLFGDLVVTSDESTQLHSRLHSICNNDIVYRKLRLMGLRKVMMEHTYAHRLAYIRAKLSGTAYQPQLQAVAVLAVAESAEEQARLIAHFQRQAYSARTLYLLQAFVGATPVTEADIHTFADVVSCSKALEVALPNTPLVAVIMAQDYYGPEYLTDLVLASTYSMASAFGKIAQFQAEGEGCRLHQDGQQYRPATSLPARATLVRSTSIPTGWLDSCLALPATTLLQLPDMLATDEFQYCREGSTLGADVLRKALEDLPLVNQGTSFAHTLAPTAESLQANAGPTGTDAGLPQLSAEALFKLIPKPASKQLHISFKDGTLQLQSTLPADKHGYIYASKHFTRQELNLVLNSQFRLEAENTIPDLRTIFEFQDADGQKISHAMNGAVGGKHALAIPNHCVTIRFGLRVQGPGKMTTQRLVLGNHGERPAAIAGQSPYLVLTKQYPAYDDLYRYGFLHSRVRGYKEHGLQVDVFRINNDPGQVYREFEGIDVASGDAQLLDDTLKTGRYKHVLVHMLDENMWRVLERHLDQVKVTVWVHGAEIQVWQRRAFEFVNMSPDEVTRQKKLSDKRVKFWQKILKAPHSNLHLVFVSNYLKNEAIEDTEVDLPDSVCSVINNFIDGKAFPYREKRAEDRLKLLSIRPYAKRVYANDLTVAAIIELSKRPFFKELSFTLVGDGELFDETVAPVQHFANVSIEKRFLNHAEIAQYHQLHGVLLVPSRMDTQGVSRDEAMSSGLVPISTNVAAIPEFVDASCGIVVPAEDYKAIAEAVEFLYRNPDIFLKLSKTASERVKAQCGFKQTIAAEINLIQHKNI